MFTIEFDEAPFFTVGADRQCNSNCSFRAALNHFVSATVAVAAAVTNTVTAVVTITVVATAVSLSMKQKRIFPQH